MAPQGLNSAAKQIASYGRGVDTELAHMSPDEMKFIDNMQGGRRTNPYTGLPEYGWLGNIIKGIARVAGATVGYSMGGSAGAAAGAGLMTKATGGSWNQALKAGTMSGLGSYAMQGLSGGGWNPTNNSAWTNAGATAADAKPVWDASLNTWKEPSPTLMDQTMGFLKSKPGLGASFGALSQPLDNPGAGSGSAAPPFPVDNSHLPPPKPLARTYSSYTGDYSKYGQPGQGGEHQFFQQDPMAMVPNKTSTMFGDQNPVQFLADGGPVGVSGGQLSAPQLRQAALQGYMGNI